MAPERVLRGRQKDGEVIRNITTTATDVVRGVVGGRTTEGLVPTLELCVKLAYYGLTRGLSSSPSVGEEYTYTLQTRASSPLASVPSLSSGPTLPGDDPRLRWLGRMRASSPNSGIQWAKSDVPFLAAWVRIVAEAFGEKGFESLVARACPSPGVADVVGRVGKSLAALHLALYLYQARFASLTDRVLGIVSVDVAPDSSFLANVRNPGYYGLALLSAIPPALQLARDLPLLVKLATTSPEESGEESGEGEGEGEGGDVEDERGWECPICFEDVVRTATVTPCGHVACWECSVECARTDGGCPTCRSPVTPGQLVRLHNL